MGKPYSQNEECRSSFKILTGTPTGEIPLGRTRRRCDAINMRNWVDSAQDRDYGEAL
jgi:hypothetical protein